ncbi:hypothetical protein [Nesterenkonia sp. F]|uniref:hypothetical protein n=1 Tax=Nesterenkonia sp. F TaxID=795955 RepID=UPI000255C9B5|nr:hypothetical protein [Nesterenkonia sp. F]
MEPIDLLLPGGLLHAGLLTVVICWAGRTGERNSLIGIRLWSTGSSCAAWQAGHRAALGWACAMLGVAAASFAVGLVLLNGVENLVAGASIWHAVLTVVVFSACGALMIRRADQAAKQMLLAEYEETGEVPGAGAGP